MQTRLVAMIIKLSYTGESVYNLTSAEQIFLRDDKNTVKAIVEFILSYFCNYSFRIVGYVE